MTTAPIGPTQQSGRFVDFAVPLQRPNTFYAASASGGLWKTENNGQTFEPLFENEKVFSIGDIAVAPSNPNILWLGSGEANNSRTTYWGDGVYKSVDAGKTWKNMGLTESHHIGRIVIHPTNPDIVYVAALGHLYSENPERGLYKTTDGGKTWTKVLDVVVDGRAHRRRRRGHGPDRSRHPLRRDLRQAPQALDLQHRRAGQRHPQDRPTAASPGRSSTNGLPAGILGRIGLTIYPEESEDPLRRWSRTPTSPNMSPEDRWKEILEGKSSPGMIDGEVYRTDDAGATWRKVSPEKQSIGGGPGYYYGQIIVDPERRPASSTS